MNMQPINPASPVFTFVCCKCNARATSADGFADLDGPAFAAYYCAKCAGEVTP